MNNTPQNTNIKLFELLKKLSNLIPHFPRIIKNIKIAKSLQGEAVLSIGKIIEDIAIHSGHICALKYEDQSYTYSEFNELVNKYANFLIGEGIKEEDTVTALLENRPELLFLIAACAKIGSVISLINPNQRGKVLIHSINLTKSKHFIVGEELYHAFEEVKDSIDNSFECTFYWVADRHLVDCPKNYMDLESEMEKTPKDNPKITQQIHAGKAYAYVFTSGTTGLPKASVQTHRKWLTTYYWFGKINLNLSSNDVLYVPLPFYHTNALIVAWPTALAGSCTMVMRRKFSVTNFWKDVDKYKVTVFIYIGELCRYLLNAPESELDRSHRIKKIMGNGLAPDIWHYFKKRFNIKKIIEFYGAADGNVVFTNTLNFDCTIGWSPQNYRLIKYDVEKNETIKTSSGYCVPVNKGETGLLISEISDQAAFDGYVNKEKNGNKILRDVFKPGDQWFNSGDLLQDMGFGHARFIDRIGDTFRWKGENVATTEVEGVIDNLKGIDICAVYGVKIPNNDGRAGMASIVKHPVEYFDIKNIADYLLKELPRYAVPIFIRVKSEISFTHTHKIQKVKLKEEGFNCRDEVFVLLPDRDFYIPMDNKLLKEINEGVITF